MAVDVRTLRIGSHVLYKGQRVEVWEIYNGDKVQAIAYPSIVDDVVWKFEPIAITPELLAELGFENTSCTLRTTYTKGCEYDGFWIEFRNLKDRWDLFVSNNNLDGRTPVRYLHEAEAFLALHGVELIKE